MLRIGGAVRDREPIAVHFANSHSVSIAQADAEYRRILSHGLTYPDGAPVAAVMRLRGNKSARRVRGPSAFEGVLRSTAAGPSRHFFLGSTQQTLDSLAERVEREYGLVTIAGCYSPPFAPADAAFIDDCANRIRETDPDLVWVGLGTPKQDAVAHVLAGRVGVPVLAVGAAFDFLAGTLKEAPEWVQSSGFEWLYRLKLEPARLWRRYLFGNAQFLWAVALETARGSKNGSN